MYNILSEQPDRWKQALWDLKVKFLSAAIIGNECPPKNVVVITLYHHEEEEDQKGKKKKTVYFK